MRDFGHRHLRRAMQWSLAGVIVVGLAWPITAKGKAPTGPDPKVVQAQTGVQTAITAAQKAATALTDAQAALRKAITDLGATGAKLRSDFNKSPELAEAKKAVADAQAAITAAQANVRQTVLSSKPEYRVALAARDAARQASDKTQKDTAATPEQMTQASNDVMTADSAVAQLEAAAFNADAGCKDAKDKYNAAVAALALMRKTFDEGLKSDPAITAAKSAVDQATVKVASAQAAVNDTQKDYATAMQALYLAQNPPPTAKK